MTTRRGRASRLSFGARTTAHSRGHEPRHRVVLMRSRLVEGVLYWGWRLGALLVQRLPSRLVYAAAVLGGEIAYLGWHTKREIAKRNFAVVLGLAAGDPEVARISRRSFRN